VKAKGGGNRNGRRIFLNVDARDEREEERERERGET
jgi:hypothetical protein